MRRLVFVFVLVALILGGSVALASGLDTIHIKASTLVDHKCNSQEWHFVINQIESEALAPASIHVVWANGAQADVSRSAFTGGVAHYATTANLGSTVTDAYTQIYVDWDEGNGQFNLSHGPCPPSPTPTAVPPTPTVVPPTPTTVPPTATTVPPTSTPIPPTPTPTTPTPVPPTPTPTPQPQTPTPVPPTVTPATPTATPTVFPEALPKTGNPFVWYIPSGILLVAITCLFAGSSILGLFRGLVRRLFSQ